MKIEFSDGYVAIFPPAPCAICGSYHNTSDHDHNYEPTAGPRTAWRIEVWKRRQLPSGRIFHTMAAKRRSFSGKAAMARAAEMAKFWEGDLPLANLSPRSSLDRSPEGIDCPANEYLGPV